MPLRTLFPWVSVMLVVAMHMCVRVCMYVCVYFCVCARACVRVCVVGPHAHMGLSSLMCVGGTPVKRGVERTQLWHDRACPCWFPRRAGCRPRHRRNHAEQPYVCHSLSLSLSISCTHAAMHSQSVGAGSAYLHANIGIYTGPAAPLISCAGGRGGV
jgi:hypothetical protein